MGAHRLVGPGGGTGGTRIEPVQWRSVFLAGMSVAQARGAGDLPRIEAAYADMNDAIGAIGLIDSGYATSYGGRDRAAWSRVLEARKVELQRELARLSTGTLSPEDSRAVELMRRAVEPTDSSAGLAPVARCADAAQPGLAYTALSEALYACFDELGNNIEFEGTRLTRVAAFDALARIEEPGRRKALFQAFTPLWRAINADGSSGSPYRRLIGMAAAQARKRGSGIDEAARTLGVSAPVVETWLTRILEAWSEASGDARIEPWDYRHAGGGAERELGALIPRDSLKSLSARYYADLGADLADMGVIYDLEPRPGKAPLAYADFVSRGRYDADGRWRPTVARVSANYSRGGLGVLNELVHEDGHVVHLMAMRTRPAFMDSGDTLFDEAFADVTSWNTYDPAWQRKYLGRGAAGGGVGALAVFGRDARRGLGPVRAAHAARPVRGSESRVDRSSRAATSISSRTRNSPGGRCARSSSTHPATWSITDSARL